MRDFVELKVNIKFKIKKIVCLFGKKILTCKIEFQLNLCTAKNDPIIQLNQNI